MNKIVITVKMQIDYEKAIFISGENEFFNKWQSAFRMENVDHNTWIIELANNLTDTNFKFLMGDYDIGDKVSVCNLIWEEGSNRIIEESVFMLDNKHFPNSNLFQANKISLI